MCGLCYLAITRSCLLSFLEVLTPPCLEQLIASQSFSSLFFQAYQFRPLTTLLFSTLTFFFQTFEIVDIKSFGVFLFPLLGID